MRAEIDALTKRVARLERANRRLKAIGVGGVLALAVTVSIGFGGKPRTIEAEKIVTLDSHNRARITIGTPNVVGAAVGMERDEPAIWLSDDSGTDRTILAADGLYFANDHAKPVVSLITHPGRPELRLYSLDGKLVWSAP